MPRGLIVSRLLIVNMILFVHIINFLKWEVIYILVLSVSYWDTWDDSIAFNMQGEVILRPLCHNGHASHNTGERTRDKILVRALER